MTDANSGSNLPPINLNSGNSEGEKKKKTTSLLARLPRLRTGTGSTKTGLLGRLKNLSKKDMAYMVSAGGILLGLPAAQMFVQPEESNILRPGFSTRADAGGAGDLFEPGAGGFAPGGAGGANDLITPLSVRDPASLIIPPGDNRPVQAPAPSQDNLRDTVRNVAPLAMKQAVKSAMPTNIPKMQGFIRGLGAVDGRTGSGGKFAGNDILSSAKAVPGAASGKNLVAPTGVKGRNVLTADHSTGSLEKMKAGAGNAADRMGGADTQQSLKQAAEGSEKAAQGGGGGGGMERGPNSGQEIKNKHDRSAGKSPGESAGAAAAKEDALAAVREKWRRISAEWDEQFKRKNTKWWDKYNFNKAITLDLAKDAITSFVKGGLVDPITKNIGNALTIKEQQPGPTKYFCVCPEGDPRCTAGPGKSMIASPVPDGMYLRSLMQQYNCLPVTEGSSQFYVTPPEPPDPTIPVITDALTYLNTGMPNYISKAEAANASCSATDVVACSNAKKELTGALTGLQDPQLKLVDTYNQLLNAVDQKTQELATMKQNSTLQLGTLSSQVAASKSTLDNERDLKKDVQLAADYCAANSFKQACSSWFFKFFNKPEAQGGDISMEKAFVPSRIYEKIDKTQAAFAKDKEVIAQEQVPLEDVAASKQSLAEFAGSINSTVSEYKTAIANTADDSQAITGVMDQVKAFNLELITKHGDAGKKEAELKYWKEESHNPMSALAPNSQYKAYEQGHLSKAPTYFGIQAYKENFKNEAGFISEQVYKADTQAKDSVAANVKAVQEAYKSLKANLSPGEQNSWCTELCGGDTGCQGRCSVKEEPKPQPKQPEPNKGDQQQGDQPAGQ